MCLAIDVSGNHFNFAVVSSIVDSVLVSSGGNDDLYSLASLAFDNELDIIISGGTIVPFADDGGSSFSTVGIFNSLESISSGSDSDGGNGGS